MCLFVAQVKLSVAHSEGLAALPASVGRLRKLQHLAASHCKLTAVPDGLGACTLLKTLDLSFNKLAGAATIQEQTYRWVHCKSAFGPTQTCHCPLFFFLSYIISLRRAAAEFEQPLRARGLQRGLEPFDNRAADAQVRRAPQRVLGPQPAGACTGWLVLVYCLPGGEGALVVMEQRSAAKHTNARAKRTPDDPSVLSQRISRARALVHAGR